MMTIMPLLPQHPPSARIVPTTLRLSLFSAAWLLATPLLCGYASAGLPQDQDEELGQVRYAVSFDNASNHYVSVEATFPVTQPKQQLFMPVWTPGSYLVREYARHIDSVEATDESGAAVEIKKIRKNRWQLANTKPQAIQVKYRVYCNEMSVRTNFVDSEFALLNGAAVFLTTDDYVSKEHVVALRLPAHWKQSVTSLERRVQMGKNTFVAANFDELVDSPFVIGNPSLHPFEVGGAQHYLVNQGGDGLWDGEQAAADVAKIVETHQAMWGQVPYKNYYFLNVISESGGGLEHDNSTVMLSSRWSFRDKKRYQSWLGLVSHEFFHTWNVRRLRPKALSEYGYEVENYFDELWVAEGVTSYYDDLALVRSGHSTPKEYLSALSKQINTLQTTDGRFKQSLAEASHDAWIKYYRPDENSRNTTISYYNKGAIVAFLLDIEIRRATDNQRSLDDVMRALYAKFALKQGYTTQDVIAEVNELTGTDWTAWFQSTIYSADELDYQAANDWLGLKFAHETTPASADTDAQTEDAASGSNDSGEIWTGLATDYDNGKLLVTSVTESGPAFEAGVNVDDEIIAINNFRASAQFADQLQQFRQAGEVDVLIARRGALSHLDLKLVTRPVEQWKLQPLSEPSPEQKQNLALWLHQSDNSAP